MTNERALFDVTREPGADDSAPTVFRVSGELDLSVVEEFSSLLDGHDAGGCVLIDMYAVNFMDSSALQVVLRAKQRLTESGVEVAVVAADGSAVARLLEVAGLQERLPRYPDIEQAKAALG